MSSMVSACSWSCSPSSRSHSWSCFSSSTQIGSDFSSALWMRAASRVTTSFDPSKMRPSMPLSLGGVACGRSLKCGPEQRAGDVEAWPGDGGQGQEQPHALRDQRAAEMCRTVLALAADASHMGYDHGDQHGGDVLDAEEAERGLFHGSAHVGERGLAVRAQLEIEQ